MKIVPCIVLLASASFASRTDVTSIIQRSVAANRIDWNAAPAYNHFERDRADGGSRTFEEMMIFGSPYERLVAIDDKDLSSRQRAAEQEKLDAVIARRQHESARQRSRRVAAYAKQRARDHLLMDQLTQAFNFTFLGEQKLDGFDVYVLRATPRPDYRPPNLESQILRGMEGKLWIDKNSFQWVKVEAQVIHPVSMAGFLASVEPGTRFELEKMPIAANVWLPKHFAVKSHARILFFDHNTVDDESYFNYHHPAPALAAPSAP